MTLDFEAALRIFVSADVEFILVGGVSAVVQGVPVNTFDIDLVHARNPLNIDRLLKILNEIDAVFRAQPYRRLKPNESHLWGCAYRSWVTA